MGRLDEVVVFGVGAVVFAAAGLLYVARTPDTTPSPPRRPPVTGPLGAHPGPADLGLGRYRVGPPPPPALVERLRAGDPAPAWVTTHDPAAAPGATLFCAWSAPEAYLVDLDGRELHRWALPPHDELVQAAMGQGPAARPVPDGPRQGAWSAVTLRPDGGLWASMEAAGVLEVGVDSRPHGARGVPVRGAVVPPPPPAEPLFVATRSRELRKLSRLRPIIDDEIASFGPDGALGEPVSLLDAYRASAYVGHWAPYVAPGGEVLRAVRVEVLDGHDPDPAFAAGRYLVALAGLGTVAVVDPAAEEVVWSLRGPWGELQDARALPDGGILALEHRPDTGRGRILEVDRAGSVRWSWDGGADHPFATPGGGRVSRLANGDTLLTSMDEGRALEIAPDGRVVWELWTSARSHDRPELVATLCEAQRVPPEALGWLTPETP